ncbi:MAG: nucleotide-binding protein, partial [Candidatus Dadabacteria bacterium]|nr:nucleotide-binding protein [Candidatus Dadabacteria bacterium]MYE61158.1 nucleotide-binding protein [Candidatus Dadabacteria bacterium]
TIDPKILPLYEKIFKRNGRALALAENEKCTSCNINIPPQLYNEILKQTKLVQCPNCKKILYTNP